MGDKERVAPVFTYSTSAAVVIVLGFACYLAAGMVELNPSVALYAPTTVVGVLPVYGTLRVVAGVVGLCALYVLGFRHGTMFGRPGVALGLSTAYAAGVFLVYGGPLVGVPSQVAAVLGSVLLASSYLLIPVWYEVLCLENTQRITLLVAAAYGLSFAFTLVVAELSAATFAVVMTALPLVAGFLLLAVRGEASAHAAHEPVVADGSGWRDRLVTPLRQMPLRVFVGTAVFGMALALVNTVSEQRQTFSTEELTVYAGLFVGVAVALVATAALALRKRFDWLLLYKLLLPILVACMLVVMVAEEGFQPYEALGVGGAWVFYRIVTATVWCTATADSIAPTCSTVAVAQVIKLLVNSLATPCSALLAAAHASTAVTMAVIVVLVVLTSVFLLGDRIPRLGARTGRAGGDEQAETPAADAGQAAQACVARAAREFSLSQREQELCRLVLEGRPSEEIRAQLCIAPSTFKTHMRNIYGKAHVHTRAELVEALRSAGQP
jgi:DNA-binding CsgD family transcriptional regulator